MSVGQAKDRNYIPVHVQKKWNAPAAAATYDGKRIGLFHCRRFMYLSLYTIYILKYVFGHPTYEILFFPIFQSIFSAVPCVRT